MYRGIVVCVILGLFGIARTPADAAEYQRAELDKAMKELFQNENEQSRKNCTFDPDHGRCAGC